MPALRLGKWSAALLFAASTVLVAQDQSVQQQFESGAYDAVVQRGAEGRSGSSEDIYLAGLAFRKMGNDDGAAGEMRRLQEQGDDAWKQIGASALAQIEANDGEAVAAARRATQANGDNAYAFYQLGMSAAGANDFGTAASAFARSIELKPDFAYAHFYGAQAFQKQKNLGKAAEHYEYFAKLAPNAPERPAVMAILRTLRK